MEPDLESTPGDADSVFRIEEPGSYYLMAPLSPEFGKSCSRRSSRARWRPHRRSRPNPRCRRAVYDSISNDNANVGILAGDLVEGSVSYSNDHNGIGDDEGGLHCVDQVAFGVVEGNTAKGNDSTGLLFGGVARGNAAYNNGDGGVWAGAFGGLAESNAARGNTGAGVRLGARSMAQSNYSTWNDLGLRAETLSLVRGNYCMTNSGSEYQFLGNPIRGPIHPSGNVNLGDHPGINVGN